MFQKLALGVAVAMLLTAPAAAETHDGEVRTSQIICKTIHAAPGSLIGTRKVCMSRLDWEYRQQRDQQQLVRVQYDGLLVTNHR